jgi:Sporulation and spore germination
VQQRKTALSRFAAGVLLAVAVVLAVAEGTAVAASQPHVSVYFVQGEQLEPTIRSGATALDAVRQLIAGPTCVERARGFRTYIPPTTRVRSVSVRDRIATVDLTEPFVIDSRSAHRALEKPRRPASP